MNGARRVFPLRKLYSGAAVRRRRLLVFFYLYPNGPPIHKHLRDKTYKYPWQIERNEVVLG